MSSVSPQAANPSLRAFASAREISRKRGKRFHSYAYLLPREKRDAVYAVSAFLTLISEAICKSSSEGECCGGSECDGLAAMVRGRIDALYEGTMELPNPEFRDPTQHTLHAIGAVIRRFEIPKQLWLDFVEGLRSDASVSRYATWTALERHCQSVGGTPAQIVACVLGLTHSDATRAIARIGVAIRLADILQNAAKDQARGRIYLPLEDLARFRYSERDLAGHVMNDHFRELMKFETARARSLLREGADALCWLAGDGSRLAASALVMSQHGVLDSIEKGDAIPQISWGRRLRGFVDAWRLAKRDAHEPLPIDL